MADLIIREAFPFRDERLYPSGWRAFTIPIIGINNFTTSIEIISLNYLAKEVTLNIISKNDLDPGFIVRIKSFNQLELIKTFIGLNKLLPPVTADIISINILTTSYEISLVSRNEILDYNGPYTQSIYGINRLLDEVSYTESPHIIAAKIDNVDISNYFEDFSIDISFDSYVNSFSMRFTSNELYQLCNPLINRGEERITITIDGIDYKFLIEKRSTSKTPNDMSFSIWGRSIICTLDIPYSNPIVDKRVVQNPETEVWYCPDDESYTPHIWQTSNRLASEIIENVVGSDFDLQMEIDDFIVKKDNFVVANETPIEIVNRLAKVVGGHVRTNLDGDVIVRYYKFNTTGTSVATYTDFENIFVLDEEFEFPQGYNKILVRGPADTLTDQSIGFQIELDSDLNNSATTFQFGKDVWFRVYRSPFDVGYTISSSLGTIYTVGSNVSETISRENSSFSGKTLRTSYPIYSIVQIERYTCEDAETGDYDFEQGYKIVTSETIEDEPVLISYTSQYDLYKLVVDQPCDPLIFEEVISRILVAQS